MRAFKFAVTCGVALLCAAAAARADPQPVPGPATDLYPGTREYEWTFYVPQLTIERREIVVSGPALIVRSRRYEYEIPGLRSERRKLGQVAEFQCKYPDWQLPNECGVAWRDVYADFPQLTMRREHVDVDVPEWTQGEQRIFIDVPHVTWAPRTLTLVVPVLQTEPPPARRWARGAAPVPAEVSLARARGTLEAGRTASVGSLDEALAALDRSIAAIEARGGDAAKLAASDGTPLDLYAARRALLDERAGQLDRYAAIRSQVDATQTANAHRGSF